MLAVKMADFDALIKTVSSSRNAPGKENEVKTSFASRQGAPHVRSKYQLLLKYSLILLVASVCPLCVVFPCYDVID